jgi:hypothetical protein
LLEGLVEYGIILAMVADKEGLVFLVKWIEDLEALTS